MKKLSEFLCMAMVCSLLVFTGCSSSAPASTQTSSIAVSTTQKVLKVAMECAYAPFNWTQATNANNAVKIVDSNEYCNGYDVQMAKKIADYLGYDLEIYKTEWTGIPTAIDSGKIDAGICGMTVNADRKKAFDFSNPYYLADFVVLTKKDGKFANATSIADLKGAICTSQQSTAWYDLLPQIPDGKIQPAIADVPTMLVALGSGKCEVVTANKPTGLAAVKADSSLKMITFADGMGFKIDAEQTHVAVAVKKGNDDLREKINKALANISEADRNKMMDDAVVVQK